MHYCQYHTAQNRTYSNYIKVYQGQVEYVCRIIAVCVIIVCLLSGRVTCVMRDFSTHPQHTTTHGSPVVNKPNRSRGQQTAHCRVSVRQRAGDVNRLVERCRATNAFDCQNGIDLSTCTVGHT